MDTNIDWLEIARKAALRVEFITNGRELYLYTNAIYSAMLWGWGKSDQELKTEKRKETKLL